jgi:hypothetical protein
LFYTVIFRRTQNKNLLVCAAAVWKHLILAMTHLNAEGDERIKQDHLAPSSGDKIGALLILRHLWQ